MSGKDAPIVDLDLKPGDVVRISRSRRSSRPSTHKPKPRDGLRCRDGSLCGKLFRVKTRVEKFVDERNGYIRRMKTPAVILDGVFCQSRYSENRLFCPREIYAWWREVWLEKFRQRRSAGYRPKRRSMSPGGPPASAGGRRLPLRARGGPIRPVRACARQTPPHSAHLRDIPFLATVPGQRRSRDRTTAWSAGCRSAPSRDRPSAS